MTKPLMRGWKALGSGRKSALTGPFCGGVYYKKGKRTSPKPGYGPLAVFDTKENANTFNNLVIREGPVVPCRYKPSKKLDLWFRIGSGNGTTVSRTRPIRDCPPGTILAEFVTCLE